MALRAGLSDSMIERFSVVFDDLYLGASDLAIQIQNINGIEII